MQNDQYFDSSEFKSILSEYEDSERMGIPCIISSEDYTDIAEYYNIKGDTEHAEEVVRTALKLYPGATAPLIFMSRLALFKYKDNELAKEYAEQIIDKSDLDYYYIKAEIMIVEDKCDEAESYLQECYAGISDEDAEDYALDVASLYTDYDMWQQAQAWLDKCSDTDLEEYQEVKGMINVGLGKFEEGEKIFNKLIDANPFSNKYWNSLAMAQFTKGDIKDSITSSEYSLAIAPDDTEAIMNKGNGLFMLGNYTEAEKYYKRYSELVPDYGGVELFRGLCFINMNRYEEALEHLRKAERLSPPDAPNIFEIYEETSFCMSKLGLLEEALLYIDKTEEITGKHDEMTVVRGHIYLENGHHETAYKFFMKATNDSDVSPSILLRIAVSLFDNGDIYRAYQIFKIFVKKAGEETVEGYSYMAYCCYFLNKTKEFMQFLKKAVKANPIEAKMVLGTIFPADIDPDEYYDYAKKYILDKNDNSITE